MSDYNYRNLRIMVNIKDPENERMMNTLDKYGTRARNQLIIDAIKSYLLVNQDNISKSANLEVNKAKNNTAIEEFIKDITIRLGVLEKRVASQDVKESAQIPETKEEEKVIGDKSEVEIENEIVESEVQHKDDQISKPDEDISDIDVPDFVWEFMDSL